MHERDIAAAALPAPTTIVRPRGGAGKCAGKHFSAETAATAVSNKCRSRTEGIKGTARQDFCRCRRIVTEPNAVKQPMAVVAICC
jgi:hypothetical protein